MNHEDAPAPDLSGVDLVRHMGHDFNNLFSIVLGGLSLLRDEVPRAAWTPDCEETYADVVSAAKEATEVIARLTAWAGRQALEPASTDVNRVAQEAAALARDRLGAATDIEVTPGTDDVVAWCDPAHLRDAVGHLLDNAHDASDGGSALVVDTGTGDVPWVRVSDHGHGMNAATLAACRQPFFTTRDALGRRGLGLCVVDGFVRASGGVLDIESTPRVGTRATLRLPAGPPADA